MSVSRPCFMKKEVHRVLENITFLVHWTAITKYPDWIAHKQQKFISQSSGS